MSILVLIFAAACVLAGAFFFIAGTLGLLRFGDTLSRVHALPLADSLADALKLVLIWALVLLGGTTAAQLVAGAVRRDQRPPE
jgi:multicomponent Na+:H+ antiporter subunit G